jgi:hypothetical protein
MTDHPGDSSDIEPPRLPTYRPVGSLETAALLDYHLPRRGQGWRIVARGEFVASGEFTNALDRAKYQNTPEYVSKYPKCALNLVCFRGGTIGCQLYQIQTVLESRFESKEVFQQTITILPSLIYSDAELFRALRDIYQNKMCGFWRNVLFLKTLRGIRLLSVSSQPIYPQIQITSLQY